MKGVLKYVETWVSKLIKIKEERILCGAGSPKFSIHDLDFGWGKPRGLKLEFNKGSMSLNE